MPPQPVRETLNPAGEGVWASGRGIMSRKVSLRNDIGIYILKKEQGWPDKRKKMETGRHIPEKRNYV